MNAPASVDPAGRKAPADNLALLGSTSVGPQDRPGANPLAELPLKDLVEELVAQQRERWAQGDRQPAEAYLRRFPALEDAPEAFGLVYGEFLLREESGEAPDLEEYQQRFPGHASQLERQVRLHRMLASLAPPRGEAPATPDLAKCPSAPEAAEPSGPQPVMAGYELLGELGRGGMGLVYKARQIGLNRIVALKVMLSGPFADRGFQVRFRAEAEAIARMQHPNIVQIFEIGTHESTLGQAFSFPFFSQEYMDGGNLAEWLAGKPQPPRDTAVVMETLARAVQYAHDHGIVHRDLKPANILLTSAGDLHWGPNASGVRRSRLCGIIPKISDFGLAKHLDGSGSGGTTNGSAVGTPEYMAPEQAAGEAGVGPPADIYALGIILYELLTGRRPFAGATTLETLTQVRTQEPVPPRRLQPKTPRDLETICLKCIRKRPQDRYPSARALADDLHRFLKGEPILARPVHTVERGWRWVQRHPAIASLLALILVLAAGGTAGITAAWLYALNGWQQAQDEGERAEREHEEAEFRREQAEINLYFSRVAQADLELQLYHPVEAERLLESCLPRGAGAVDRRGWEWHYLKGLLHADLLTLPSVHNEMVADLAFSPDGRRLVTAGGSPFKPFPPDRVREWEVWGPRSGRCRREFPHPRRVHRVAYADGGRRLVWAGDDGVVRAADLETGRVVLTRSLPAGFRSAYLSPGGRYYASIAESGKVHVWELETGKEVLAVCLENARLLSLSFGPDGRTLAVSAWKGVHLLDLPSGREVRVLPHDAAGLGLPAFSPDGRLLALGTRRGMVKVWEPATGRLVNSLAGHAGQVLSVAFSPDGRRLATGGADRTVRLWDVQTGAEVLLLRGHEGRASRVAFHPSGRYLASGSEQPGDVKVWDLTRPQEYLPIRESPRANKRVEAIGFSGDGELLHILRVSGCLQSCGAATGLEQQLLRADIHPGWMSTATFAAFTADGRRLAAVSADDPRLVRTVDVATGKEVHRLPHLRKVIQVAYSRDGRRLATATLGDAKAPRALAVWDMETGRRLVSVPCGSYLPAFVRGTVALGPKGEWLAHDEYVAARGGDGEEPGPKVVVHDLETGRVRFRLDLGSRPPRADGWPRRVEKLAFSGDGRWLAVSCDEEGVYVYDCRAERWQHREALHGSDTDTYWDLAFNPDGRRLAALSREQVLVWDVATGQKVLALRGAPPRPSDNGFNPRVIWSGDGRRLAASNWNHSVSIWDAGERERAAAKQGRQVWAAGDRR